MAALTLRQPATSAFHLQQLPPAAAAEANAEADAAGPVVAEKASPAKHLQLQPLLAGISNSSPPPQRLHPTRAASDWLSDDDDSEASVQLLPPAAQSAAPLLTVQPADSGELNTSATAAADSLHTLHALPLAMVPIEPGASRSNVPVGAAAITDSSADANRFEVVASVPVADILHAVGSSPAAQDALQVAVPVEVST